MLYGGGRTYAQARGQPVVALSSCEAELYATCEAFEEANSIKAVMGLLQVRFDETGAADGQLGSAAALPQGRSRQAEALGDTSSMASRNSS